MARSPASTGPDQCTIATQKVSPTRSGGTNGNGGAIWNAGKAP